MFYLFGNQMVVFEREFNLFMLIFRNQYFKDEFEFFKIVCFFFMEFSIFFFLVVSREQFFENLLCIRIGYVMVIWC